MTPRWRLEKPRNEMDHILSYAPGTPAREALLQQLEALRRGAEEIPLIIGGQAVRSGQRCGVRWPHEHRRLLARAHLATAAELKRAVDAALQAQAAWAALDWCQRTADLLAGPRRLEHIAAIMVNRSKTPFEAEIDLAELVDFWRFNASSTTSSPTRRRASSTVSTGGHSKASCWRCRPSTSTPSTATWPPRRPWWAMWCCGSRRAPRCWPTTASCSCCRRRGGRRASSTSCPATAATARSPQLDIWPAGGGGMPPMACPYYRRIRVDAHISTIHGYCEAEETWRLRVVTLQEETQYCTTEQHTACPAFRAREARRRGEEDICAGPA
jgi:hypothetical protein